MVMTVITAPCISTLLMLMGEKNRSDRALAIRHRTTRASSGIWPASQPSRAMFPPSPASFMLTLRAPF